MAPEAFKAVVLELSLRPSRTYPGEGGRGHPREMKEFQGQREDDKKLSVSAEMEL